MSGRLSVVELGEADLGVGVDEGLLVDAPDALQGADIEGVLGAAIAGAFGVELAMGLLVGLGLLEGGELALGEDQALLGHLGLERLQPVLHGLQVVAQPNRAHPEGRDRQAALGQFVGDAHLAPGRLFDRQGDNRRLDLRRHPVLQDWLSPRYLLQREFAAFVVELLEAVKAVARVAHHLAGLADIAELLGQFEQAGLGPDDLLVLGHGLCPLERHGGGCATPTSSAPAMAHVVLRRTPSVRLSQNFLT